MAPLASETVWKFTLAQLWAGIVAIVAAVTLGVWIVSGYLAKVENRLAAIEEKTGSAVTQNQAELWAADMRFRNVGTGIVVLNFKEYREGRENERSKL